MKKANRISLEELKLDYNEATELFSDETLNAMQMAKVTGGKDDWVEDATKALKVVKDAIKESVKEAITEIGHAVAEIVTASQGSTTKITTPDGITVEGDNIGVEITKTDSTTTIKTTPKRP